MPALRHARCIVILSGAQRSRRIFRRPKQGRNLPFPLFNRYSTGFQHAGCRPLQNGKARGFPQRFPARARRPEIVSAVFPPEIEAIGHFFLGRFAEKRSGWKPFPGPFLPETEALGYSFQHCFADERNVRRPLPVSPDSEPCKSFPSRSACAPVGSGIIPFLRASFPGRNKAAGLREDHGKTPGRYPQQERERVRVRVRVRDRDRDRDREKDRSRERDRERERERERRRAR